MQSVVRDKLWVTAFWLSLLIAVATSWWRIDMLYIEPRQLQLTLIGQPLSSALLTAAHSTYAYDGSGADMWVYVIDDSLAAKLRSSCGVKTAIQFYDSKNNFENKSPLYGCVTAKFVETGRIAEARLAGNVLMLYRSTH